MSFSRRCHAQEPVVRHILGNDAPSLGLGDGEDYVICLVPKVRALRHGHDVEAPSPELNRDIGRPHLIQR